MMSRDPLTASMLTGISTVARMIGVSGCPQRTPGYVIGVSDCPHRTLGYVIGCWPVWQAQAFGK